MSTGRQQKTSRLNRAFCLFLTSSGSLHMTECKDATGMDGFFLSSGPPQPMEEGSHKFRRDIHGGPAQRLWKQSSVPLLCAQNSKRIQAGQHQPQGSRESFCSCHCPPQVSAGQGPNPSCQSLALETGILRRRNFLGRVALCRMPISHWLLIVIRNWRNQVPETNNNGSTSNMPSLSTSHRHLAGNRRRNQEPSVGSSRPILHLQP